MFKLKYKLRANRRVINSILNTTSLTKYSGYSSTNYKILQTQTTQRCYHEQPIIIIDHHQYQHPGNIQEREIPYIPCYLRYYYTHNIIMIYNQYQSMCISNSSKCKDRINKQYRYHYCSL